MSTHQSSPDYATSETRGWFLVVDAITGDFTVEGPMPDVEKWKTAVQSAQQSGAEVKWVFDEGLRDEAVAQAEHQFGGSERFPSGSIVSIDGRTGKAEGASDGQ